MSDLEKRTLVELRKMAKELGIPAISGLKKRELIEKIEQSSEVQKMILYLGRLLPTFLTEISTKKPKLRRSIRKGKSSFLRNWERGFWRYCRMDMGFCVRKIACPAQMMCMFLRRRFADLI